MYDLYIEYGNDYSYAEFKTSNTYNDIFVLKCPKSVPICWESVQWK